MRKLIQKRMLERLRGQRAKRKDCMTDVPAERPFRGTLIVTRW